MDTLLASVFSKGRYVGAILHRGPMGYEAIGEEGNLARVLSIST